MLYLAIFVLSISIILIFFKIKIILILKKYENDSNIEITLSNNKKVMFSIRYKISLDNLEKILSKKDYSFPYKNKKKHLKNITIKILRNDIKIKKISFKARLGLEDAHILAVSVAILYGILGVMAANISNKLENINEINIQPCFNKNLFAFKTICIAEVRVGYFIILKVVSIFVNYHSSKANWIFAKFL